MNSHAGARGAGGVQGSTVSGSLAPNSAATRYFGLMFGDTPRGAAGALLSHAGSVVAALAS